MLPKTIHFCQCTTNKWAESCYVTTLCCYKWSSDNSISCTGFFCFCFWHPTFNIWSSIFTPTEISLSTHPLHISEICWQGKELSMWGKASPESVSKADYNKYEVICFLWAASLMLFSMYHKEVKSSVWRSCVEARHLSLNRWLSLESHLGTTGLFFFSSA